MTIALYILLVWTAGWLFTWLWVWLRLGRDPVVWGAVCLPWWPFVLWFDVCLGEE